MSTHRYVGRMLARPALLLSFIWIGITGCFRNHVMTERRVARHYKSKPVKPTFHTIENDSVKLYYASVGADSLPVLLLIHGAPGGWFGYMNMLDDTLLQKHFRIVAVDRLGYGKSRWKNLRAVTSIQKQAAGLRMALEQISPQAPVILVGRSYGAAIAAQVALDSPEKISHLFMIAPPIDPEKEKIFWFAKAARLRVVQWFLPRSFAVATAEKFSHAAELREMKPHWQNLNVPVTILQGGKDWIADPTNLDFARKYITCKKARFFFLPSAGHYITETHVGIVKRAVMEAAQLPGGSTLLTSHATTAVPLSDTYIEIK